ncbi:MAG: DNA topoisomerase 3 [Actinomycetota bacterium]
MSRTLIICEKPSVARDVANALPEKLKKAGDHYEGEHWVVAYAVGHLVEQVDPEAYDERYKKWKYEDLPIVPRTFKYEARDARSSKTLKALHTLMGRSDVERIVNACDAGREGELIFKLILQTAPKKAREKPVERAWFSSMTKQAIRDAFAGLRPDEQLRPLEEAARARSEADWLVGMNATRAATTRAGSIRKVLSLGRVQTPTLALIVGRELQIDRFVAEDYWEVEARFVTDTGTAYTGLWHRGATTRLTAAADAEAIRDAVTGRPAVVDSVETKPQVEQAPLLYDLTTLQREANQRFGFSAQRTLSAAQACYERHKVITYPRTNSRYLSGDLAGQIKPVASRVGAADPAYADGARYVLGLDRLPLGRVVNDARVTDHHAIIPTDDEHRLDALSPDERRIYDLVARRFLAVFHPPARFERTVVETRCEDHLFRSRGKVMLEAGWRAVYGEAVEPTPPDNGDKQADGDGEREQSLPALARGDASTCETAEALAKRTKPPARYTESTLLRAMETAGKLVDDDEAAEAMKDAGLGTPATRAATIERLIDVGYVEREGKALRATEKGVGLVSMLGDHLLTSPELTGRWEQRLNRIERGEDSHDAFRKDVEAFTRQVVEWFADKERADLKVERRVLAPCPTPGCGGSVVEYPKSYACDTFKSKDEPGCGYTIWKRVGSRTISREEALEHIAAGRSAKDLAPERTVIGPCPTPGCGGEIIERPRSYGCTSWKSRTETGCGYVIWKKARGQQGEVDVDTARAMVAAGTTNAAPAPSKEPIGECPTPGCGGKIVENSRAYGCTSWKSRKNPGCGFVIWKREKGHDVTREEAAERLEAARAATANGGARAAEPAGTPTP